jgi:hypothetical protein
MFRIIRLVFKYIGFFGYEQTDIYETFREPGLPFHFIHFY